jgi:DNA invertase Pin-like site-specific DNA recombinase
MARAYSYIRFSTLIQESGDSLRRQTERSLAWCKSHGHILDDSLRLHDKGVSAWKGDNLTSGKLGAFLAECKAGRVPKGSILIVESLDRLSRQGVRIALKLFLDILDYGVSIVTLQPEYTFDADNVDEMSLIIAIVVMGRSHEESDMKSYRGKEAWEHKRSQARFTKLTGKCPLWMRLSDDRTEFVLYPARVEAVRKIFELSCQGLGGIRIVKFMNANVPPFKKVWSKTSIRRILSDRAVLGEYQPCTGSFKNKNRKPVGEAIKDYYPRILDDETFYHAQKAMKDNLVQRGRQTRTVTNLFTGLVKDTSGGLMAVVKKDQHILVPYEATRGRAKFISFPYEYFEIGILRWLKELKTEDVVTQRKAVVDKLAATQGRLDALNSRIAKIKRRLKAEDDIEPLMDVLRELDHDRKEVIKEVAAIKEELASSDGLGPTQNLIGLMDTSEEREEIRQRIKGRIRELISSIVVEIKVDGHKRWAKVEVTLTTGIKRWILLLSNRGVVVNGKREWGFWHQSANSLQDWEELLRKHCS